MCSCLGKNTIYSDSSANNSNVQVTVTGWKQVWNSGIFTLRSDGTLAELEIAGTYSPGQNGTYKNIGTIPSPYTPQRLVFFHSQDGYIGFQVSDIDGSIKATDITGSATSYNSYIVTMWRIRT